MASLLLVVFGFVLLVLQSALGSLVPMHRFAPNLLLPIAIFLGASAEVPLWRGALISFVLGYFLDSFSGNPMGLQTFGLTASFLLLRGSGMRVAPEGPILQMLSSFVMTIIFGATVLSLRAIFEQPALTELSDPLWATVLTLLYAAIATALFSPLIFLGTQRLAAVGRKREQKSVAAS